MIFHSGIKFSKGDLILEHINKCIGNAIKDNIEQFEDDVVNNYKLTNQISKKCMYDNRLCKKTVMNELMYGIESKLVDNVIDDLCDKPFYYFYEIYADPACPQVFKQLSADDFFFFSCYVHGMCMLGVYSRQEVYDMSKVMYKKDFAAFLTMVRNYGLKNN